MIVHVILHVDAGLSARAAYAIETVLEAVGVGYRFADSLAGDEEIVLAYGGDAPPPTGKHAVWIQCPCCAWLLEPERDQEHFARVDESLRLLGAFGTHLPFWGRVAEGGGDDWVMPEDRQGFRLLRADLFGNVFLHLSRIEEHYIEARDRWGRFEAEQSLLGKARLLCRPVVDMYIRALGDLLGECCQRTGVPLMRKALWPCGKPFAVCLTHDVDRVDKWTWKRIVHELLWALGRCTHEPDAAGRQLLGVATSAARGENPYWSFESLLADEDEFGAISTFFLSTERKVRYDPSYAITDERIGRCIQTLRSRRREVGLHPTFSAYQRPEDLEAEERGFVRATGLSPSGVRFHYLRLNERTTLKNADSVGLGYDTTLGYASAEGFRTGGSLPFHPFDLEAEQPLRLLEIPFCIMDATLTEYRGYDAREAGAATRSLWERVRASGGLFCVLLHQTSYDVSEFPYMRAWYRALLRWMRDEGALCATAEQVADWWRARAGFTLNGARRNGAASQWRYRASVPVDGMKLVIQAPTAQGPLGIEVEGAACQTEPMDRGIGVVLGPLGRDQEIRIRVWE